MRILRVCDTRALNALQRASSARQRSLRTFEIKIQDKIGHRVCRVLYGRAAVGEIVTIPVT